eukprot:gene11337-23726_t
MKSLKLLQMLLSVLFLYPVIVLGATASRSKDSYVMELTASNVSLNIEDWDTDLAIVFYAPWCRYCKQLLPSWEEIAYLLKDSESLTVGKFNCEKPQKNADICSMLKVDRYPTVGYLGYGNFNQAPPGNILGTSLIPRFAKYTADLYPEGIYDWIRMLYGIGAMQRKWDDFIGIFTGNTRASKKVAVLQKKINKLENKVVLFGDELEKYKAFELFDKLEDHGDPFPLLSSLEPDKQNLPLRVCVAEMSEEYC